MTANALAKRVEHLMTDSVEHLKRASLTLYMNSPKQKLSNEAILSHVREVSFTSSHEKHHIADDDWHKYVHGDQPASDNPSSSGTKEGKGSSFDYSKYSGGYNQGYENNKHKKNGDGKGSDKNGETGFDYSQYIPKSSGGSNKNSNEGQLLSHIGTYPTMAILKYLST